MNLKIIKPEEKEDIIKSGRNAYNQCVYCEQIVFWDESPDKIEQ